MSKLTKKLASTSKQLKLETLLSPAVTKAVKSRSASSLDENVADNGSPAPKKMIISEASSGTESDVPTSSKVHPLFGKDGASKKTSESQKPSSSASAATSAGQSVAGVLIDEIRKKRVSLYESVAAFRFNKKRVRVLSEATDIPDNSNGIVYWMSRDQRVQGKNPI